MQPDLESRLADLLLVMVHAVCNPSEQSHYINNEFMRNVTDALNEHYSQLLGEEVAPEVQILQPGIDKILEENARREAE